MLQLKDISHHFDGLEVLRNIAFNVAEGELLGLIGPNGAGKTTLFNIITGFVRPQAGRVLFKGGDVTGYSTHRLARLGLVRTFQGARTFANLSVADCLRVARYCRIADADHDDELENVLRLLDLDRLADGEANSLPAGLARLLGIAMALSTGARLLLLDEPAAGLSAEEIDLLQRSLRRLRQAGVTIVVVDHNLHFLMNLVSRAIVLDAGRLIADGPPQTVTAEPQVIEAYIGGDDLAGD
ncbi:MAG: ATP-binding cassette domain-containing protein [Xanthobacteraceae bacterium]